MSDEPKVTLSDCLQHIIESGKSSGKSPEQVRDEMVKMLDHVIGSLENDDGMWDCITEILPEAQKTL